MLCGWQKSIPELSESYIVFMPCSFCLCTTQATYLVNLATIQHLRCAIASVENGCCFPARIPSWAAPIDRSSSTGKLHFVRRKVHHKGNGRIVSSLRVVALSWSELDLNLEIGA